MDFGTVMKETSMPTRARTQKCATNSNFFRSNPNADLSVLHYVPTALDLFYDGSNLPCHEFIAEGNPEWYGESLSGTAMTTGLVGLSRSTSNMELFLFADKSGSISSSYWFRWEQSGNQQAIRKHHGIAAGTSIVAVSRKDVPSHMEIFYVGNSGALMHSYTTDAGANWFTDAELPGAELGQPTLKGMSVVSRNYLHQQIWWITPNGALNSAQWDPTNSWVSYTILGPGSVHPSSGLVAVAREQYACECLLYRQR